MALPHGMWRPREAEGVAMHKGAWPAQGLGGTPDLSEESVTIQVTASAVVIREAIGKVDLEGLRS